MALAAVVLVSPGLESLIPRFCNRRVVLLPEIIPALDTAASVLSTGSRTPTLLSGAGNEQEKPPSRLVPHTVVWLGTPHHKKGQQKCFETWRLDAAVVPIHSHAAAKDRAGLTLEVPPPAPERNQSRLPAPDSHFQALLHHLGRWCAFSLFHVTPNINVCHREGKKVPQDKVTVSSNCPRGMLCREEGKDLSQQGTPQSTPR